MKIEMKSTGSSILELMVKALCREIASYTDDVFHATSQITSRLNDLRSGTHIVPSNAYRAVLAEDLSKVEVWHYTPAGDRDRLVLTLTK